MGSCWRTEIIEVKGQFFPVCCVLSAQEHQKTNEMSTTCKYILPLNKRWKKGNLGSLQLIFLIIFENWLSISFSRPKVAEFNNLTLICVFGKYLTFHYRPVSMCFLSSKTHAKQVLCVCVWGGGVGVCQVCVGVWGWVCWGWVGVCESSNDPIEKFGPLVSEFNNLTLK